MLGHQFGQDLVLGLDLLGQILDNRRLKMATFSSAV